MSANRPQRGAIYLLEKVPEGWVLRRSSCPKQDSIWSLPTIPPSKRNHRRLYRRATLFVDVHRLGQRPPLLILYRTLYPRPLPPPLAPSGLPFSPASPLADLFNPWTSRNFQFFRVPRQTRLPEGLAPRRFIRSTKFHVHLHDSEMRSVKLRATWRR